MSSSEPVERTRFGENQKGRARSDRATGSFIALLMLLALLLVSQRVINVATGPLPPRPGVQAPTFTAQTAQGANDGLDAHRGSVVLLDFWATWCPPCVASLPHLDRVHQEYKDRGFVVLGVNQEPDRVAFVRRFMERNKLSFDTVIDPGGIAKSYGVFSFPTSFLVDRKGVICQVFRGPVTETRLRRELEPLLDEKSTGC